MRVAAVRVAALLAGLLLASCASSAPGSSPQDAMRSFLEAVQDDDCEAARAVVVTPSAFDCSQVDAYGSLLDGLDTDDADITQKSRTDSSAVVTVTWPDGSSDFEVERIDGSWKILIDTAA